jgi:hypothetical protein
MKVLTLVVGSILLLAACEAMANEKQYGPGVTDTEIKIGQTVPYSGPASVFSSYGRVMTGYFQMLNEKGGINGRKVNLISLDNAFSPPKAIEQTLDGVLAEVGTVGTVPNVAVTTTRLTDRCAWQYSTKRRGSCLSSNRRFAEDEV